MKEIPFVVILPAYNAEAFLEKSVGSVTGQGYENYRIVIIDDGSSDNTGKIAEQLSGSNEKIKVISQSNRGQIVSRSNGVQYAKKNFFDDNMYFLFLDADDAFKPGALNEINRIITQNGCDILIFDADRTDIKTGKVTGSLGGDAQGLITSKSEMYKIILFNYRYNSLCRKAISAKLVTDENYERFSNLRHAEDLIQSLGFFSNANSVFFVKESFYYYYTNPNSVTNKVSIENYPIESTARAYSWEFIKKQNVWSKQELDRYAEFLLELIEKKISSIALYNVNLEQKAVLFEKMKNDPFYSDLLSMDLPHDKVIDLFIKEKYSSMINTVKMKRIVKKLTRR